MNAIEDPKVSDQRLRAYYISLGLITPARWTRELEEYEAAISTTQERRRGLSTTLRLARRSGIGAR